jgi:hypothetical protein
MRNVVVRGLDINDLDKWVTSEAGLWGLPASVYQSGQRTQMDGIWITNPYSGAMSGALSGTYIGETPDDAQAALKLLRKSLRDGLFWVSVLTAAGWQSMQIIRSGELTINWLNEAKVFQWATQVTAPDPVWFRGGQGPDGELDTSGQKVYELGLHRASGGLVFPWKFPIRWGTTTTTGEATVYVPYAARLIIEIKGLVTSPSILITQGQDGYVLTWDGLTLGYGETLVVDPLRRSALLGGSSPAIPSIREWPDSLSDGYWTIRYSAAEYNQVSKAIVTVKEIM